MADAESKNNICTEGHLNSYSRPTLKKGLEQFLSSFALKKGLKSNQNRLKISADCFIIFGKGFASTRYYLQEVQLEKGLKISALGRSKTLGGP